MVTPDRKEKLRDFGGRGVVAGVAKIDTKEATTLAETPVVLTGGVLQ